MRSDFHGGLRQNRTGIHGAHNAEHRSTSHLFAGPNGTLYRSRAAPLRKQREMQVIPAHRQRVEHILLQDFAVRHHCGSLSSGGCQFGNEGFLARIGFDHRQAKLKRGLFHGIRHQLASTTGRRIRSGEYGDHFKMLGVFSQHLQRRHSNIRSTGKQHFQHGKSSLSNPHSHRYHRGIIPPYQQHAYQQRVRQGNATHQHYAWRTAGIFTPASMSNARNARESLNRTPRMPALFAPTIFMALSSTNTAPEASMPNCCNANS